MKHLLLLSLGAFLLSATSGFASGHSAGETRSAAGPAMTWSSVEPGNDTLNGGYGNDRLYGATAHDAVNGGPGWDRCGAEREENCEAG